MLSNRFFQFFRSINLRVLAQVIHDTGQYRLVGLSAEMAYNNVLALFPVVVATLAILGTLQISQDMVNFVGRQLINMAPEQAFDLLQEFIKQVQVPQSITVAIISVAIAIWVASGSMSAAMSAMDQIYQTPRDRIRPFWKSKLISVGLTMACVGLVLLASFLVFLSDWILRFSLNATQLPSAEVLSIWELIRWFAALSSLALAFSLVYRYGPSQWRQGTPLLPGAMISALLWAFISRLFRWYVSSFSTYSLTYGALSAGIVLLLWLNLSSLSMLIGAQLNVTVGAVMRQRWRLSRKR